jgi:DNA polymerase-3 subunit gamma/tau
MSYIVLARKYRPKSFATLVGQEHVVKALTHALDGKRLHHAYLFTGTRGVGKTTIARILAKALNCETGVSSTPCGVCATCMAIDAGRFIDYIEMDAASNRGIDEMTQILESAPYKLDSTRYKVLMIDEVHMLTNTAFNAMLKTLEEPPDHVKFVLATTDPQKIPVTVLSRCLQFNLKQMPQPQIVGHLERVFGEEGIGAEKPALRLLAQAASGSMRDALSLADQAIAYSAGPVTEAAVRGMLGTIDSAFLLKILAVVAERDGAALHETIAAMEGMSLSFAQAMSDLAALLSRIAVAQAIPAAVSDDLPDRADVMRLATAFSPEEVQLFYQIAIHGKNDLPYAPDEATGFMMTALRMLSFRPDDGSAAAASAPAAARMANPRVATERAVERGAMQESAPAPAAPGAAEPAVAVAAPAAGSFEGDWPALIARLPLTGFVRTWANKSEFVGFDAGTFALRVPTRVLADDKPMQEKLRAAIEQYLGRPTRLAVQVGEMAGASVAAITEKHNDVRQRAAEASIDADPFVKEMVEKTGAAASNIRPV